MESFRSKSKNEGKYKFWPPGVVQFFPPQLCVHILFLYIKDNQFHVLYAFFFTCLQRKPLCFNYSNAVYRWHLDKDDFRLEAQNSPL